MKDQIEKMIADLKQERDKPYYGKGPLNIGRIKAALDRQHNFDLAIKKLYDLLKWV
jgi:hypothetical protein